MIKKCRFLRSLEFFSLFFEATAFRLRNTVFSTNNNKFEERSAPARLTLPLVFGKN